MAERLPIPIDEFIESEWNEMEIYEITLDDKARLLGNSRISKKEYKIEKGKEFPLHQHDVPQLLLVEKGELTHYAEGREYAQYPNELLIVPANLPRSALAGKLEELVVYVFKKNEKQNRGWR